MIRKELIKGNLAALTMMFIFGIDAPIMKSVLPNWINAYGLVSFRMIMAALAAWIISFFLPNEAIKKGDWRWFIFAGLFGILFNQGGITIGVQYSNPIDVGIIVTMGPIIVLILSAVFLHNRITWRKGVGTILGLAGVMLLTFASGSRQAEGQHSTMIGNLIVLGGTTAYALYLTFTQSFMQRYHLVTLMKWIFLIAAVASLPVGLKDMLSSPAFTTDADWTVYARMAFSSLGATFTAFMMNMIAMKRISGASIAMYGYLQPIISAIIAVAIGQAVLTGITVISAVLVAIGIYLVVWASKAPGQHNLSSPT